jgi:hypothetical protein
MSEIVSKASFSLKESNIFGIPNTSSFNHVDAE